MESLNDTIEDDIDQLVESAGLDLFMNFFRVELLVSCFVGLFGDCLIVYVILQSKRMLKSNINLVMLNWAIVDGVFLILIPFNYRLFTDSMNNFLFQNQKLACVIINSDVSLYFIVFSFVLLLTVDRAMNSSTKLLIYLIAFIYTVFLLFWMVTSIVCSTSVTYIVGYEQLAFFLLFLILVLVVIANHVWRCWRKRKSSSLRLNIATIFICNWILGIISIVVPHLTSAVFMIIFAVAGYLNSVFILIYLVRNDVNYKMCILKLFHINSNYYEMSAAMSIAENRTEECNTSINIGFINDERCDADVILF